MHGQQLAKKYTKQANKRAVRSKVHNNQEQAPITDNKTMEPGTGAGDNVQDVPYEEVK